MHPRILLLSASILILFSCSRTKLEGERNLIGKWQLTSYYVSPGGATKWQDADPANPSYLEFTSTGQMIFKDKSGERAFSYKLSGDDEIIATRDNNTNTFRYSLQGKELTLNAPCIEPCIYKYKQTRMRF